MSGVSARRSSCFICCNCLGSERTCWMSSVLTYTKQIWSRWSDNAASSCFGTGQALRIDVLEPRHELEAQQMAESKGHLVLPMGIDKLLFNRHLGTMPQHAFDHRRHFRR